MTNYRDTLKSTQASARKVARDARKAREAMDNARAYRATNPAREDT